MAEVLEIAEFVRIEKLPNGVKKEEVRIKFLGEAKERTWQEYVDYIRKQSRKEAKKKLTKQIEELPDVKKEQEEETISQEVPNGTSEETSGQEEEKE